MNARVLAPVSLLVLLLAGCVPGGGGDGTSSTPTPSETTSASPSASPSDVPVGDRPCNRDDLTITYAEADSSAGHRHGVLTFLDSGSADCSLQGYPIVFMGNSEVEAPVGPQAAENPVVDPVLVDLAPGEAATAALTITQAGIVEGCTVASSDHLIVAPPLDHVFVWEDDGRHANTPPIDSCFEETIGLLDVGAFQPA
jgi:hypothetical protein